MIADTAHDTRRTYADPSYSIHHLCSLLHILYVVFAVAVPRLKGPICQKATHYRMDRRSSRLCGYLIGPFRIAHLLVFGPPLTDSPAAPLPGEAQLIMLGFSFDLGH
jgi:hypothetical protein